MPRGGPELVLVKNVETDVRLCLSTGRGGGGTTAYSPVPEIPDGRRQQTESVSVQRRREQPHAQPSIYRVAPAALIPPQQRFAGLACRMQQVLDRSVPPPPPASSSR